MDTHDCRDDLTSVAVQVFSVGHSDHPMEAFLALLRQHQIAVLADVRSQPYSQWAPQFNKENLARSLQAAGIRYTYLGDILGGRPANRALYSPGEEHPDYELMRQNPAFQDGIRKLLALATTARTAMMCAEGDYHKCHRGMLITPALLQVNAQVLHIGPHGEIEEARLEPKQLSLL